MVISYRAINAFLNTGNGGTVYLGIVDDGVVKGIRLSQYQVHNSSVITPTSRQCKCEHM